MIDAHQVPPQLQDLLMMAVGNKWPTGDESALRAEAAEWRQAGSALRDCAEYVVEVRLYVRSALQGPTGEAIDSFLNTLVGSSGSDDGAVLPVLARCCDDAADVLDDQANQIETLRIEIIGALTVLAVQLAVDTTVLFWFGGPAIMAAEITATRVLCVAFLREAIIHALTRVAESVVAQEGFALLAQIIELGQRHRHSMDGGQLEVAAANGAIGGAVGFGAGLLGGALARSVRAGDRLRGAGVLGRGAAEVVGRGAFSTLAGMAEGDAQDAAFGLSGDWVSGAANGAFSGVWNARHTAMNPRNLGSISPADRLEGQLNSLTHAPPRTPGSETSQPRPGTPPLADASATTAEPTRTLDPEEAAIPGEHEVWYDAPEPDNEHTPPEEPTNPANDEVWYDAPEPDNKHTPPEEPTNPANDEVWYDAPEPDNEQPGDKQPLSPPRQTAVPLPGFAPGSG